MLKFLRTTIIAVGIVLIGAAIALMIVSYIQINYVVTTLATANLDFEWKTLYWFFLAGAGLAALLGAFSLGLGIGMPKRTFKQRLKETEKAVTSAPVPPAAPAPVPAVDAKDES
ncbi:MAG: hypothetical protein LBG99_06870 [Propionibacteriaceae bacterium]|nr:hypothetical protein [Propionibacteriaceae bacterium]